MITLSIVIPTMGRDTLARTLESIQPQLSSTSDQVYLVADGQAAFDKVGFAWNGKFRWPIGLMAPTSEAMKANPGGTQRNFALECQWPRLGGDYLLWCGDDDIYLPGALDAVRRQAEANPGLPLMFRMITPCGARPWQEEDRGRIERHYVGDHMFVAPNLPLLLGRFGPTYSGDYDFIRSTMDLYAGDHRLIWCPETLVHCRPEGK